MSYDIYFVRRASGQSWEDALDAMDEDDVKANERSSPEHWGGVVSSVRDILGDVSVIEDSRAWEIDDRGGTEIQVSCFDAHEWSVTVPYWSSGEAARQIAVQLRAVSRIIQDVTGLEAYDPQTETAVMSDTWTPEKAALVFDQVARSFQQRGMWHGGASVPVDG